MQTGWTLIRTLYDALRVEQINSILQTVAEIKDEIPPVKYNFKNPRKISKGLGN